MNAYDRYDKHVAMFGNTKVYASKNHAISKGWFSTRATFDCGACGDTTMNAPVWAGRNGYVAAECGGCYHPNLFRAGLGYLTV